MARTLDFSGAQCDLRTNQGAEISFPVQLTAGGQPLNKDGRTYKAEMKRNVDDPAAALVFAVTAGASGTDPFTVSASFDDIQPGVYYWDLWEKTGAGDDRPLVQGRVIVERRVVVAP